jgi:CelD/BcsL family acetyltransferase involved in cellulose biosynthesis
MSRPRPAFADAVRPSRSAAIGAIRVARSAGTTLAMTVTTTPTSSEMTIVRIAITDAVAGRSAPIAVNSARRAGTSASPPSSPSSDAVRPMIAASSTTERSTWRRVAPSIRSSASSRVRCATVIENVL